MPNVNCGPQGQAEGMGGKSPGPLTQKGKSLPPPGPPCLPGTPGCPTHPALEPCLSVDSFWKQCLNMLLSLTWSHVFHLPPGLVSPMPRIPGSCVTSHHTLQVARPWPGLRPLHTYSLCSPAWPPGLQPNTQCPEVLATRQWQSYHHKFIKSIPVYLKLT